MTLLLDIGTIRVKWASLRLGRPERFGSVAHVGQDIAQVADKHLAQLPVPERVVACAAPDAPQFAAFERWALAHWDARVEPVRATWRGHGVTNGYQAPRQLGPHRWAALIGARALFADGALIVDCGAVLTADALDADGAHLGGVELPGLHRMRQSLAFDVGPGEAARSVRDPWLADNPRAAAASGTLQALAATVEHLAAAIGDTLPAGLALVVTGGDATQILPMLRDDFQHEPHLVLQGLAQIAGDGS